MLSSARLDQLEVQSLCLLARFGSIYSSTCLTLCGTINALVQSSTAPSRICQTYQARNRAGRHQQHLVVLRLAFILFSFLLVLLLSSFQSNHSVARSLCILCSSPLLAESLVADTTDIDRPCDLRFTTLKPSRQLQSLVEQRGCPAPTC